MNADIYANHIGAIEKIIDQHERHIVQLRFALTAKTNHLRWALAGFQNMRNRAHDDVCRIRLVQEGLGLVEEHDD